MLIEIIGLTGYIQQKDIINLIEKLQILIENFQESHDFENNNDERKGKWELSLGLRVYSKCHQGEFPTNKKQDSECNDPEADTNTIYPKEEDKEEKENMEDLQ
ncbi:2605_t:CDS:2 [Entrophospora sp. SA101]|nr:2605_t:CDS:2 [Entrophospora sp. SA101]